MLTHEEALIVRIELFRRGYVHSWLYGNDRTGWRVRARRYAPDTAHGQAEQVVEVSEPEQLRGYLER